jgi:flagellar hook-associated protein 2
MVDVVNSLTSALGISSGIDTTQLVSDLTTATYQPKQDLLDSLISINNSRISALASAKSSLKTFSDALSKLMQSSTYSGQPASGDTSIVSVTAIPGGNALGLPAQIEVTKLAAAQVLESIDLDAASDVAGTGTLTLTVDGEDFDITLDEDHDSLADLASAINDSGAEVTASIVTDQSGARLVLKGTTGEDQAFTLTDSGDADANLLRFVWDGSAGTLARRQEATNAELKIDNVAMEFDSNVITTAIPNLRLDLNRAAPGTKVTIATDQPSASMSDLVKEIVDAYNTLKGSLNTATRTSDGLGSSSGLLTNDSGIRDMVNRLSRLTSTQLSSDGPFKTLSDIGVSTNRDGTLSLDTTRLETVLATDPAAVTEMLNPTTPDEDHIGIAGALQSISDYLNSTNGPLTASNNIYSKLKENYQDQLEKVNGDRTDYSAQLTRSYTAMQSQLLQLKATQSYLDQQIAIWNGGS